MRSNASSSWRLYVIVDRQACGDRDPVEVAAAAVRGGADVIQLRDKSATDAAVRQAAERLRPVTQAAGVPLIVNDRVEVVGMVGADGVHLGQQDSPTAQARRVLGIGRLIGRSTHSLKQALAAQAEGTDYLGFGPIFPTPTKPTYRSVGLDAIAEVVSQVRIPVVCIGGVDRSNVHRVLEAGAECVAVVRAVCRADDPEAATRHLKILIEQFDRTRSSSNRSCV